MTTNPTDPIVLGRYRGSDTDFTVSAPFSRFFAEAQKALAVDKVYFVLPGAGGFSLKDAGQLVVSFQPFDESSTPQLPPVPVFPPDTVSDRTQNDTIVNNPGHTPGDERPAPRLRQKPSAHTHPKAPRKKKAPRGAEQKPPVQTALNLPSRGPQGGPLSTDGFKPATAAEEAAADLFGKVPH